MRYSLPLITVVCLIVYSTLFFTQEHQRTMEAPRLTPAIPAKILDIVGHTYLKQLMAEVLYIKVAVYYGGLKKEATPENLSVMSEHFKIMSQLHPNMIDVYYRAQSALAHRGDAYVQVVNQLLETGRVAMPREVALPFFEGFNYLNYLDQPLKAAAILKAASDIDNAPQWLGHLASVLMAGDGNIRGGLALLQGMYANSQNQQEKKRYQNDIQAFKKAWRVQQALKLYQQQQGKPAASLQDLVPQYLPQLPVWKEGYELAYHVPTLSLHRRSQ